MPEFNKKQTPIELKGKVCNFLNQNNIHMLSKERFDDKIFNDPKYSFSLDEVRDGFLEAFKNCPNKEPSADEVILAIEKQIAIRQIDKNPVVAEGNDPKPRIKLRHP